jgi:hypothetical protein
VVAAAEVGGGALTATGAARVVAGAGALALKGYRAIKYSRAASKLSRAIQWADDLPGGWASWLPRHKMAAGLIDRARAAGPYLQRAAEKVWEWYRNPPPR